MRTLYLARHGEATRDLTSVGREQAHLLALRLAGVPLTAVHHSPVARAAQTAAIVAAALDVPIAPSELLADYPPYLPMASELSTAFAPRALAHLEDYPSDQRSGGPTLGARVLAEFTSPDERHDLLITHSQIVSWFVRAALGAPEWRWLGLDAANAGLTIIQYRDEWPPSLVTFNDQSHLPPELRWTGYSEERRGRW
ncbi:MAG: histidine phosphatase family protein [Actinophytocola sp.]|uniref:histidine phosphatase family protein n=1 Tax=Actinophytocola sp. TaxID=1872138 RepID=UPI0013274313|nr:histidine phosphatase family protein [Actinophytocola sp.]MPZ83678.1 histidine phosphatase family protein [Actinophytocola sp.]